MTQTIFAIDVGTQSVRAVLFDLKGNLLALGKVELQAYFSNQPGWAEQEADYYWQAIAKASSSLWKQTNHSPAKVIGLSLTTQRATVVPVDGKGHPLRPAILWLDQRTQSQLTPLPLVWRSLISLIGASTTVKNMRQQAQSNWIACTQPELWEKTEKFLLLSGYLNFRLTGRCVDSVGSQVGYIPFDYKKQCWAAKTDWRWNALSLKPEMMPDLMSAGGELGELQGAAARHLGLSAGLPVIASGSDKACEILGSGVVSPEIASLSFGTTATINTVSEKYCELERFMPAYPAAVPGLYSKEAIIYRGFWMVSWFKEQFGVNEQRIAEQQGIAPEALFDQLVNEVPEGSMGLMLQPYWSPGTSHPEAKGGIIGFGDVHTRSHFYRAILEGLAYGLREGKEHIEKKTGVAVSRLRISGGGSQSNAAMQLTADIFGLAAERPHTHETSALGAAINVAVGLAVYPNYAEAAKQMTRVGRTFVPNDKHRQIYDRLYREVYLQMYKRLKPLYESIRGITGYPA